jgi:glycine/D-amino acid oxidase-like deaminating enzyme
MMASSAPSSIPMTLSSPPISQAWPRGSRGAEIYRNTTVTAIEQLASGEWLVKTDKGDITCEHVVMLGNLRKTGAMVGLDIPSFRSSTSISSRPSP